MEEDGGFEVVEVAKPTGAFLDFLNLAVDPLGDRVREGMRDKVENVPGVAFEHLGYLDHGLEA